MDPRRQALIDAAIRRVCTHARLSPARATAFTAFANDRLTVVAAMPIGPRVERARVQAYLDAFVVTLLRDWVIHEHSARLSGEARDLMARIATVVRRVYAGFDLRDRLLLRPRYEGGLTNIRVAALLGLDPRAALHRTRQRLLEFSSAIAAAGLPAWDERLPGKHSDWHTCWLPDSESDPQPCLTRSKPSAFITSSVSVDEREAIERYLVSCRRCCDDLYDAVRLQVADVAREVERRRVEREGATRVPSPDGIIFGSSAESTPLEVSLGCVTIVIMITVCVHVLLNMTCG